MTHTARKQSDPAILALKETSMRRTLVLANEALSRGELKRVSAPRGPERSSHITPADGNVFADLGFSAEESKTLLAEADARIAGR